MKKKLLYLLILSVVNISLLFSQRFIIADDIYYQKGDELINENFVAEEETDTIHNILILEPEIRNYEEGTIIYKNTDGTNDTIYIFDDPEFYLNP